MRRILLFLLCSCYFSTLFSQDLNNTQNEKSKESKYQIFIGVNAINNLGLRSPLNSANEWAFETPISLGFEINAIFIDNLSFEETLTFNKIADDTYFSADSSVKYSFNDLIQSETFEIFAQGGLGLFNINGTNVSANIGGGMQYWFNDTLGIRIKSLGKFAFNAKDNLINNNHFQHFLEVVFKIL